MKWDSILVDGQERIMLKLTKYTFALGTTEDAARKRAHRKLLAIYLCSLEVEKLSWLQTHWGFTPLPSGMVRCDMRAFYFE